MKLIKTERIKWIVQHLENKFDPSPFKIKDFWEGDLAAIGFSNLKETRLVYLSTYQYPTGYFVSLESGGIGSDHSETIGNFNNQNLEELESLFSQHLGIV